MGRTGNAGSSSLMRGGGGRWGAVARALEPAPGAFFRVYAQILFSRSPAVGALVFAATTLSPRVCVNGAFAVAIASLTALRLDLDRETLASGGYGYNALLAGLGIAAIWGDGGALGIGLTTCAAVATVFVAAGLRSSLLRTTELPVLSIPFLAVFHLVLAVAPQIGLSHAPPEADVSALTMLLPTSLALFFQSLGSLFFLGRTEAGIVVFAALLLQSRIAALLAALAFALVYATAREVLVAFVPALVRTLGYNAMLTAIALGGVWFVPSPSSFVYALTGAGACVLLAVGVMTPLSHVGVPVLILPFNVVVGLMLLAARQRAHDRSPKSVDFIPGSPEENLHYFRTRIARFETPQPLRFRLPFRGRWTCTQAVDGEHTHQGPWRHAFDFEVLGSDGTPYQDRDEGSPESGSPRTPLATLARFHCYRLPVLASAAGTVVRIESEVADNPLGQVDTARNWGNLVLLQHGPGLYSLAAHLCRGSVRVAVGQVVRAGEVIGLCGNSGRSPQPHLHFQLQASATLGAPTLPCAFSDVVVNAADAAETAETLVAALEPAKDQTLRNLDASEAMASFVRFSQGDTWTLRASGGSDEERVHCEVDLYGQFRLRAHRAREADLDEDQVGADDAILAYAPGEDLLTTFDVVSRRPSVVHLIRAALPRVPLEWNPQLVWRDYLPQLQPRTGGLASILSITSILRGALSDLASPFFASTGLEMQYRMERRGALLVIIGASLEQERRGRHELRPRVETRIELAPHLGPIRIEYFAGQRSLAWSRDLEREAVEQFTASSSPEQAQRPAPEPAAHAARLNPPLNLIGGNSKCAPK